MEISLRGGGTVTVILLSESSNFRQNYLKLPIETILLQFYRYKEQAYVPISVDADLNKRGS